MDKPDMQFASDSNQPNFQAPELTSVGIADLGLSQEAIEGSAVNTIYSGASLAAPENTTDTKQFSFPLDGAVGVNFTATASASPEVGNRNANLIYVRRAGETLERVRQEA